MFENYKNKKGDTYENNKKKVFNKLLNGSFLNVTNDYGK